MTSAAQEFITPLTFQALSGNPVHTDLLDADAEAAMGHIELARWADLILIAPATANSIARLADGSADDLLTTTCLASTSRIAIAPAMNHVMWSSEATQGNVRKLRERGLSILGPASGSQACGETGEGRMLEADQLVTACTLLFQGGALQGLKLMITAGPTHEPIDPVRFIGNRSSGRMGFALAEAAVEQGAKVTLIAGPVNLPTPDHVTRIDVETAQQMHTAVMENITGQQIFIGTAAVADYRPQTTAQEKLKKSSGQGMTLTLVQNPDIVADVAALQPAPFTLGFAAETQDVKDYALAKLQQKNLSMIAANQVYYNSQQSEQQDIGFNSDYNALHVFWTKGELVVDHEFPSARKTELARQLITLLAKQYRAKSE